MKTQTQKEHDWLRQLVGEWAYETECSMEPGKPAERFWRGNSAPAWRSLDFVRGPGPDAWRRRGHHVDDLRLRLNEEAVCGDLGGIDDGPSMGIQGGPWMRRRKC